MGSAEDSSKRMKFSSRSMNWRLSQTPLSSVSMSTTPAFLLGQPFPLVKVGPLAGDGADLCLLAVGEHHHRVMEKDVGDSVAVVGVVLLVGGLEIAVNVLALDEEQGQAVDEADDVRPAAVEIALHPHLAHTEKVVVLRGLEVEDPEAVLHQLPTSGRGI